MKKTTSVVLILLALIIGFIASNVINKNTALTIGQRPVSAQEKAAMDAQVEAYINAHPELVGKSSAEQLKADTKTTATPKTAPPSSSSDNLGAVATTPATTVQMLALQNNQGQCVVWQSVDGGMWKLVYISNQSCAVEGADGQFKNYLPWK